MLFTRYPVLFCRNLSVFQKAAFSTKKVVKITPEDLDIVVHPNDEYMKSFMTGIGAKKTNFKLCDHYIWKDTFKDDYKMVFFCLKGTKKVIACHKQTVQRALPTFENVDAALFGLLHADEEYRGTALLKILSAVQREHTAEFGNIIASLLDTSSSFGKRAFPTSQVFYDLNITLYNAENVKIPSPNLIFDDIIVKSAHDVPDNDITKYDQSIYQYDRKEYMLRHLRDPEGFGKMAYDRDGKVIGFGTITMFPSGDACLFPLYCDSDLVAQAIFQQCLIDIAKSGKKVKRFEAQMPIVEGFDNTSWMKPFLTHEPQARDVGSFYYSQHKPVGLDFKKVYSVTFPPVCAL